MDGLIHAALEAEGILNRAKNVSSDLRKYRSDVQDHKMTWSSDKMHLSEPVDDSRSKFHRNASSLVVCKQTERFDLFQKLHELYNELSRDESLQSKYQGLKTTSYLLEKLLVTYNLNTLIINLYPGNKGYSLSLKINGSTQSFQPPDVSLSQDETLIETPRWPYEEEELLSYIDNEELPVVLLDLLETEHSCLFYSGCIIAQIRDYRQAYPNFLCDTHHVLLRPTNQSIITDAMCLGSSEERAGVEAALVLATAPPLCLDPRPAVGLLAARLHSAPRLLNTPRIRRQARRFTQVAVNRKRKLDQFTHYHGLELLDLIHRQRAKNSRQSIPHTRLTSKYPKKPPDVFKPIEPPKMESPPLALPSEINAPLRLARSYDRPKPSPDCQPQLVEEYILETEKTTLQPNAGFFHIKLSILQRPSDQEFLGELYVDRDHVEGERNGAACRFTLGSRIQANKYIQQFTEIFTEEGRKSVRIKHVVPGQLPRVSFTGGKREFQQGQQQIILQQRAAVSSTSTVQTHTTPVSIVTSAIVATPTHTNTRTLPILQAQLQCATAPPTVGGTTPPITVLDKPLPSPNTPRLSPQVHDIHVTQPSTNQLLAQQLTNPPQPLNPQKMQSAIIHIQHPLMSTAATPQVQNIQYTNASTSQVKPVSTKPRTTNPAISALVTSLMNSAQQFQQAANQNAGKSTANSSSNSTIVNLLKGSPAPPAAAAADDSLAHAHKMLGRTVSLSGARLLHAVSSPSATIPTYTHQQAMSYRCESNEATNVSSSESALLERLISPGGGDAPPATPAASQQPTMCHVQGLSLASLQGLQGIQGLQNVQVQIPGLSSPISLSLNVSGAPSGLLVSVPSTSQSVMLSQPSVLSLPIAQLMSGGVKGGVRGGVQLVRPRAPAPRPTRPAPTNTGTTQFIAQSPLNPQQVRRKSNPSDGS